MTELAPLSERVPAHHAGSPLPADADGLHWRRASEADADALVALHRAMDAADHPERRTAQEMLDALGASYVDPQLDTAIAERGGRLVASGFVLLPTGWDTHVQIFLPGGVHPKERGQGIGRAMLGWQRARSIERLASLHDRLPVRIVADLDSRVPHAAGLFDRLGFAPDRSFSYMVHRLDGLAPAVLAPPLTIVDFDEQYNEPLRLVKNAVFVADHWGSQPESEERWAHHVLVPTLRRDLSRLVVDGDDRIAGFVVVTVFTDQPPEHRSAYIALVGVDRDFRGRGVAQAAVLDSLARCAADGITEVGLDVDDTSPTGADRLYTKLGFVTDHATVSRVLSL